MIFKDRLLAIIRFSGKNTTKFGNEFKSTSVENIRQLSKKDNANPSLSILEEILSLYPDINADWLLTGNGEMLTRTESQSNLNMVNAAGEVVCNQCARKDIKIEILEDDLVAKNKEIAGLNQEIGSLKNQLNSCGCGDDKRNSEAV